LSSGAKVVLALLGATVVIALIAVAGFLLTDEESVRCVEGQLQDNEVGPDGQFLPRTESFATIEDAEAFVCRRVPHPRDTGDLTLKDVEVTRTTNLGQLIEGAGRATVTFRYAPSAEAEPAFSLEVTFPSRGVPDVQGPVKEITIAGQEAALVRPERGAFVFWSADGLDYASGSTLEGALTLEEMLAILDSVR
jgi:hypothetical protein